MVSGRVEDRSHAHGAMLDADGIPNGVATRDTTAIFSPPTPEQFGYTADELRPYGYTGE